ncbi:hypothetical protein [Tessaracoccus coleopterorum]|nr:hypothetical protein [Tessaracoccus coleopterorum]
MDGGASRRFDAVSLDVLDALVDEMEDLAVDTGTAFDGWGAEIG